MPKPKVHLALYGNVGLQRGYCATCEQTALIVDGDFQCCGMPCEDEPKQVKRISAPEYRRRRPTVADQARILQEQDYRCFWCERQFGQYAHRYGKVVNIECVWDHVSPYVWSADNGLDNFVASCRWCNSWKAALIFRTIEEVKVHVATKWEEARESHHKVRELSGFYSTETPVAKIL